MCNNNVDHLKGRKETVQTPYIIAEKFLLKVSFFVWSASGRTHYRKCLTGEVWPDWKKDAVRFDTSSQGGRHFLFAVATFSGASIKVLLWHRGCPAASVLQGGQAANSDRIAVGYVKCLHQQVTGYIFRTQQGAADPLKRSLTLVLARAESASGGLT